MSNKFPASGPTGQEIDSFLGPQPLDLRRTRNTDSQQTLRGSHDRPFDGRSLLCAPISKSAEIEKLITVMVVRSEEPAYVWNVGIMPYYSFKSH